MRARSILGFFGAGVVALAPLRADAIMIFASDCNFGFQDVYNAGDAVCVTGEMDVVPPGQICAEGYIIVTTTGGANPFFDVSAGGANYVLGCAGAGAFYDEYVWLPPLVPGQYDLVIDQFPFFGAFGAEDLRLENAFTVSNAPIVFSVDVAAIKGAAMNGLDEVQAMRDLVLALTIIDTLSTAADWAGAFGPWGAGAGIALGVICYTTNSDCPTSYNSAVITIGNKIIGNLANSLELHYGAIIADPPDPNFEVLVPLVFEDAQQLGGPFAPGSAAALPSGQTAVAQLLSTQAAAYQALVPTLEKLQGAQEAASHFGLLIQAEKTQAYAQLAIDAGDRMLEELDAIQATLEASGNYDTEVDAAGLFAMIAESGLTDDERAIVQSYGYSESDIDDAIATLGTLEVPEALSWAAVLDRARASFATMRPQLVDLIDQAENIRAENEPLTLRIAPVATLDAPASGAVGEAIALSVSATHPDPDAALVYAWDLDGDGEFDDGDGQAAELVAPAPGLVSVAVEVSDGARRDLAFALVDVVASNAPPEITAVVPVDYSPFADAGEAVDLSVDAEDADGDPLTFAWSVDGAPVDGDESSIVFEMPDEEHHVVQVVVADDDPYSADARFGFHVRASVWDMGGTGDDTGADTGADTGDSADTSGSASDSITGADASATDPSGTPTSGDTEGDGDGGAGSDDSGGCGCSSDPSAPNVLGLSLLLLGVGARRRRHLRRTAPCSRSSS